MTNQKTTPAHLTDQFLIAMPNLEDPYFNHAVIYICAHNEDGAMGLIINHAMDISFGSLLNQMKLETDNNVISKTTIHNGGPIQKERGFVLHKPNGEWNCTICVSDTMSVTTSKDIIHAIATAQPDSPKEFLIALGYAAWASGQLEQEIATNSWLTVPVLPRVLFQTPPKQRWRSCVESLGIDVGKISPQYGHA